MVLAPGRALYGWTAITYVVLITLLLLSQRCIVFVMSFAV